MQTPYNTPINSLDFNTNQGLKILHSDPEIDSTPKTKESSGFNKNKK
jgi:hypothetical protein